jgi:hypothetical protein
MVKINTLADYPWIVVRVGCSFCKRGGQYRLARLVDKYGSEIPLEALLDRLAADCPWRPDFGQPRPRKYEAKCGAYFPDLKRPQPPPDLPPSAMALRVIQGGKG